MVVVVVQVAVDALVVAHAPVVVSIVDLVVVTTVGHALANVKAVLDALVAVDVIMVVMGSVRVAPMAALEDVRPLLLQ